MSYYLGKIKSYMICTLKMVENYNYIGMLRNMLCIYALTYLLGAFYYIEYDILRT